MTLLIIGVVAGVIAAAMVMSRKKPESSETRVKRTLADLDRSREERESRHQQHWLSALGRLPVVDPARSELLHAPVYDCVADEFELPCLHGTYALHGSSVHGGMLYGFVPESEVRETLVNFSDKADEGVAFIEAADHAYLIWTDTLREPGGKVYRFVRTGPDEFHVYGWRSGMRPAARDIDPPYHVRSMSASPEAWLERMRRIFEKSRLNTNYQNALRRCPHPGLQQR